MEAMATATAKVLLQFLTSLSADCCLAAAALVALLVHMITEQHATVSILVTVAWAIHFATMASIDIKKGGNNGLEA